MSKDPLRLTMTMKLELLSNENAALKRERDSYLKTLENLRANFCAMTPTPIIKSWIAMIDAGFGIH